MINNRPKIKISINKIFMEDKYNSGDVSENSIEEDYSWANKKDKESLKKLYIKYKFKDWAKLLNIDYSDNSKNLGDEYKNNIGKIFKEDIFKNESVFIEKDNNNIFKKYIMPDFNIEPNIIIQPDFIVKNIKKENFIKILNENEHMFRTGKKFKIPEVIDNVTVIGECKTSPEQIKSKKKQKGNYLLFRNNINNKQNNVYFVIMYVFDQSYESFWNKTFMDNNDIIICYIPKLYNKKHLEVYDEIIKGFNIHEKDVNNKDKNNSDNNKNINIVNNNNDVYNNANNINKNINIVNNNNDVYNNSNNINNNINKVNNNNEIIDLNLENENQDNNKVDSFLDIYNDLDKKFESIKTLDDSDILVNGVRIQEKEILNMNFKSLIELYKQEKIIIENTRKIEDNILKRKRKREDEELISNYKPKFNELEIVFTKLENQGNKK